MNWKIREHMLRRTKSSEKLKVVAVRIDPVIERRLRFLAETSGRKPSFFLQQLIEGGISALEEVWLPSDLLAQVRAGAVPEPTVSHAAPDLFDENAFVE
jgi:RHH-type transcriptional regulator, rel operon repressor / antitoxin RelB